MSELYHPAVSERWLDKRGLAAHLACSVRSIETALTEGMPHAVIFGRVKFQASEVEAWLEQAGICSAAATGRYCPRTSRPGSG